MLVNPTSANILTPTSEFPKPVMTAPSVALGGKLYGSQFLCVPWMTLWLATGIILIDRHRVGSPSYFSSCGVMKSPISTVFKIPIVERTWYCRPKIC